MISSVRYYLGHRDIYLYVVLFSAVVLIWSLLPGIWSNDDEIIIRQTWREIVIPRRGSVFRVEDYGMGEFAFGDVEFFRVLAVYYEGKWRRLAFTVGTPKTVRGLAEMLNN